MSTKPAGTVKPAPANGLGSSGFGARPEVELVPLESLHPAPWNPRTIREERFQNLCRSIEADPEFLWRRPILAQLDGTIMAGNMRYRAASHLGMATVPAIVEDVPEQLAKERSLRDNAQWGDWQDDQLAAMVYQMAADGADVKLLGIEEDELARLLGIGTDTEEPDSPAFRETWAILIECDDESNQALLLERFQSEGLKAKALIA